MKFLSIARASHSLAGYPAERGSGALGETPNELGATPMLRRPCRWCQDKLRALCKTVSSFFGGSKTAVSFMLRDWRISLSLATPLVATYLFEPNKSVAGKNIRIVTTKSFNTLALASLSGVGLVLSAFAADESKMATDISLRMTTTGEKSCYTTTFWRATLLAVTNGAANAAAAERGRNTATDASNLSTKGWPAKPWPERMLWIPGGEFWMGSDEPDFADARPWHRVYVDGFWMDKAEVTNEQFEEFVKATGYVTLAERTPTKEQFPTAPGENLVAGSVVFTPPNESVPLDNGSRTNKSLHEEREGKRSERSGVQSSGRVAQSVRDDCSGRLIESLGQSANCKESSAAELVSEEF
jgi:hypothetical protein